MSLRNQKVNVYVDLKTAKRVKRLAEASDRSVSSIINGFVWQSFIVENLFPHKEDIEHFLRPGKWCRHVLYTRLPSTIVSDLEDAAWERGIRAVSGKSSGVGVVIGQTIAFQLEGRDFYYWRRFFSNANDYLNRVIAHMFDQRSNHE